MFAGKLHSIKQQQMSQMLAAGGVPLREGVLQVCLLLLQFYVTHICTCARARTHNHTTTQLPPPPPHR
jgi:hypothetical protein